MIDYSKIKLSNILTLERQNYYNTKKDYLKHIIAKAEKAQIFKFQKCLRKAEYYMFKKKNLRYKWYLRKKNIIGNRLGISIHCNCFDEGLYISHAGLVVVNGEAVIGKNCILHGGNCIGNKNNSQDEVPTIGDNFELGFGSVVYGKINVCDDVKVGVNSVINKDITSSGVYVGLNKKTK